jgi:crossover junction endodeoxyribonuclease RuvC
MTDIKTVLAIDSSLACPAFAILEFNLNEKSVRVVEKSHVKTNSKKPTGYRLSQINQHVNDLLYENHFDEIVMEKGFNRFAVATQQIQRTVGVLMLRFWTANQYEVAEIAPTTVKKILTGSGKASKDAVADALESYVGKLEYKNDDESDAVGVGIAHGKQKGWL